MVAVAVGEAPIERKPAVVASELNEGDTAHVKFPLLPDIAENLLPAPPNVIE